MLNQLFSVYDIITSSSITGLIVHEAFGHGVEMDQFVKDRALSKQYMGKRVAAKGVLICMMVLPVKKMLLHSFR